MILQQNNLKFITRWKEELMSAAVIIVCLVFSLLFPISGFSQNFSRSFFFFFLIPVLFIRLILKGKLSDFGFNFPLKLNFLYWSLGTLLFSMGIAYLLINFTSFKDVYALPDYLANHFWWFLFYELILINFILFLQEFFFRGFVLFSFLPKLEGWSILISALAYLALSLFSKVSLWQAAPSLILSISGGFLAYKTGSFVYSYLMGLLFLLIMDSYLIYLLKSAL